MTLKTQRVVTLEQVRAFLDGSEPVDFAGADREGVYSLVRRTLVRLDYHRLGKSDKGLVKRYLGKVTGFSRAQLTRLIGQYRATGGIADRRARGSSAPFQSRYTRLDIRMWFLPAPSKATRPSNQWRNRAQVRGIVDELRQGIRHERTACGYGAAGTT